ncbi:hypothetical protein XMM354_003026 [Aliiroseovarius sp. xm-m-354]|nr:hypothetical protein [Aliiroseovarius sp. xm-m-378]NRP51240.1 hypothetical protein [Aliiroseovarius sp. xm-m-354]NRP93525.1 hypothetical protein [Aliiroseovarius sp. xm-a-134]NRQ12486.1 hypothetical protein [Aliiroseovarius sp. xm-v-208]NRQ27387.1 hypothetical protein [Aliiroseovarius sp. xm-g-7]
MKKGGMTPPFFVLNQTAHNNDSTYDVSIFPCLR